MLVSALMLCAQVDAAEPATGLWFSPDHDGHGFDLQRVDDRYIVVFYSYTKSSEPVWYLSVASEENGMLSGTFSYFNYQPGQSPPQRVVDEPGTFTVDFVNTGVESACADAEFQFSGQPFAVFTWQLNETEGQWCVTPLLQQHFIAQRDYTGLWWAGPQDEGWGLSLDYEGAGELRTEVAVLFYYDQEGLPRWALGATAEGGAVSRIPMQNFKGYCPECPVVALETADAGFIDHTIELIDGRPVGVADLDMAYRYEPGGDFSKSGSPLIPLSDLAPAIAQLPASIAADQNIAFIDATLVPMTDGFPVIPHQSVLVADGVIVEISPADLFEVPGDAMVVTASGFFLAPGMSEMHLHISIGGVSAMEQAGLLMIANGVTTALNMGNSFSFDVPGLDDRFAAGELIGPTLYAGQVAYGPGDGADATLTVANGPAARNYAEKLETLGYDYIKTYWQLPVSAWQSFQIESRERDLPLIGHIPLRQPMSVSLSGGHRMAAHIQEPYVSHMGSVRNEALLPGAVNVFLNNGTYLTPTLAVFESYVMVNGGRQANYDALIAREGHQYQPDSITGAWEAYFQQRSIQNGNAADLDELLAFFKNMTKYFFDAGVPLLNGTDAPGFPGVMSGFGAHEELRLLHELGIPVKDVFAIATRNAGRFVDDTLGPETGFGTIETGKRADLILTTRNPLISIEHVKRPAVVMARGRFWSQAFLQQKLDQVKAQIKVQDLNDPRYMNTETIELGSHH